MLDKNDLQQLQVMMRNTIREEVPILVAPLLSPIYERLDSIEERLTNVEARLTSLEVHFADLELRVTKLEVQMWKAVNELQELREDVRRSRRTENEDISAAYVQIERLDSRVSVLEAEIANLEK
jgi:chromosome segregation ATPase